MDPITFIASFSALRVNAEGDAKAVFEIPASELAQAVKLVAVKEQALTVTVTISGME